MRSRALTLTLWRRPCCIRRQQGTRTLIFFLSGADIFCLEQPIGARVAACCFLLFSVPRSHASFHFDFDEHFVLFCLPCNSRCACGGMTTAGTTFPSSNLGWLWPTCSPFVERGALCTECCPCHMGRRARALLTPYIEGDQLQLGAEAHSPCERA